MVEVYDPGQQFRQTSWATLITLGVLSIALGVVAIVTPFISGLAFTFALGAALLLGGAIQLVRTLTVQTRSGFWWSLLTALLTLGLGYLLIRTPVSGMAALSTLIIAYFMFAGAARMFYGFAMPAGTPRGMLVLSGIISVILGGIIWSQMPDAAAWILGTVIGVDLISDGVASIEFARQMKRLELV